MIQCVAIVAIVAMFFAFLAAPAGTEPPGPEVILQIDPPPGVTYVTPPPLPDRNPHR